MNNDQRCHRLPRFLLVGLAVLAVGSTHSGRAATLWTGPITNWTKSVATPSDTILPGEVVLTRGSNQVLYNLAAGETSAGFASPAGTLWAFGELADYASLSYQTMESMRNGDLATLILNQPMVLYLTNDDIYLSIVFRDWGQSGSGTVSYDRSTPAPVSILTPSAGSVFAAPADIQLTATASLGATAVTNVEYFAGVTSLGHATVSPFEVTAPIAAAGAYGLQAVATAGGISVTSAVVNITVVAPVPVVLAGLNTSNGNFSFQYNATPGLSYLVQSSSNLFNWVPVLTNVATSSPVLFAGQPITNAHLFYRVGRLPNP